MQVSFKAVIFLDSHDTERKSYFPFQSSSSTMQMILFSYHVQPIKMVAVYPWGTVFYAAWKHQDRKPLRSMQQVFSLQNQGQLKVKVIEKLGHPAQINCRVGKRTLDRGKAGSMKMITQNSDHIPKCQNVQNVQNVYVTFMLTVVTVLTVLAWNLTYLCHIIWLLFLILSPKPIRSSKADERAQYLQLNQQRIATTIIICSSSPHCKSTWKHFHCTIHPCWFSSFSLTGDYVRPIYFNGMWNLK